MREVMVRGRALLSAAASLAVAGCVTNHVVTQTSQQTASLAGGTVRPTPQPARAPAPSMTPAARIASARLLVVRKTTTAGASLLLASPQSLAPDCKPQGNVTVKVTTEPEHGVLSVESGTAFPNFSPGDPPFRCNGTRAPATLIRYTAAAGFSGQDTAVVDIFFPDGRAPTAKFEITVR